MALFCSADVLILYKSLARQWIRFVSPCCHNWKADVFWGETNGWKNLLHCKKWPEWFLFCEPVHPTVIGNGRIKSSPHFHLLSLPPPSLLPPRCRSTKTHPGPVVHLSDSPKDEGKVGEPHAKLPASTNSNCTAVLFFFPPRQKRNHSFLAPAFNFSLLTCRLHYTLLSMVPRPASAWLLWGTLTPHDLLPPQSISLSPSFWLRLFLKEKEKKAGNK